jgi:hypothetical protein
MGSAVPGELRGPAGAQLNLFPTRCPQCQLRAVCGEYRSSTACRDPSEYRPGAAHPDRVCIADDQLNHYREPPLPGHWQGAVDLPSLVPVAHRSFGKIPPGCAVDAPLALALGRPAGAAIACFAAHDRVLERMWKRRARLGSQLTGAGVSMVVAPGFSTWWPDPPFDGLHQIARTMEMARRLADELDTVPMLVWRTDKDVERWVKWLAPSAPEAVAIDMSTFRTRDEWAWAVQKVRHLAQTLEVFGLKPRLISVGPAAPNRLRDVREAWPHGLTVMSRFVWQLASAGYVLDDLGKHRSPSSASFRALLSQNVAVLATAIPA